MISELARGAELSFENAKELFREAVILFKHGSIYRAYFLHQISIEEFGKIELIGGYAIAHLMDFQNDPGRTKQDAYWALV
jgi:AbiV family abortive infection protein